MENKVLSALIAQYGEAFYLLDLEQFETNFNELKTAFSSIYKNFNIAYSYKTNYIPELCKIVSQNGGYAEVVSEMELELAHRIGVETKNIIWNGPIKNPIVLETFLLNGGTINIDSYDEFKIVKAIVSSHPNSLLKLGIRVNYDVGDNVCSRFGFDINDPLFEDCLSFVLHAKNVDFVNFQCHFAKRNIEYWPSRIKGMINMIDRLGVIPKRIDFGGGLFGKMPDYLKDQFSVRIPNYVDYATIIAGLFKDRFGDDGPELIIEPGSALVGDCMKFVCTIKTIKCVRGKWFASVLGSQKNISMGGVNPPLQIIHMGGASKHYDSIDFVGYTCIENDVLYRNFNGDIALEDVVVISNCGSYSVVMKPPFILPNFPIIGFKEKNYKLVKKAETFDDIFRTYEGV